MPQIPLKNEEKSFRDMPAEILEKITNNLDLINRISMRRVCRFLQFIIDRSFSHVKRISFTANIEEKAAIRVHTHSNKSIKISFEGLADGCRVEYKNRREKIKIEYYLDMAMNALIDILKMKIRTLLLLLDSRIKLHFSIK